MPTQLHLLRPGGHMGLWLGELVRLTALKPAKEKSNDASSSATSLPMIDPAPTIRLTGLKNVAKVEAHFVSDLVDIAYIDTIGATSADLILENVDLQNPTDREWIIEILRAILKECDELQAQIVLIE